MGNAEVRFRVDDTQNAWLTTEAKKVGVPKSKILLQLINAAMSDHKSVNGTSDTMVGMRAKVALMENIDRCKWLKGDQQVLWMGGYIWFVGKTANGSQVRMDRWLEAPLVLFEGIEDYQRSSATDVKLALANWHDLKGVEGIEYACPHWFECGETFFDRWSYDSGHKDYNSYKKRVLKEIEEATAALEVANDAMVYEVLIDAVAPLNEQLETVNLESQQLTGVEFRAKLGFVGVELQGTTYSKVCSAGKTTYGWLAPNGDRWLATGVGKDIVWTRHPVTSQVAETKVLSIV
jgi:hypothetical protein